MMLLNNNKYLYYKKILTGLRLPLAFIDLDAFDANISYIASTQAKTGKTIRIASKSLRCIELIKRIFSVGGPAFKGIMAFTVEDAGFLVKNGLDNILVAYPSVQPSDMEALVKMKKAKKKVYHMIDSIDQLKIMSMAGQSANVVLDACIDIDMSYRPFSSSIHLGVRRSPVHNVGDAVSLARESLKLPGVVITAFMGYEAQVAGLPDASPYSRALNPVVRFIKKRSIKDIALRRAEIVKALKGVGLKFDLINGGGSGSLKSTGAEDIVTEVAAGSGFYDPHLFGYYKDVHFEPAAFFGLQVVRRPTDRIITCHGGGYIASGSVSRDKQSLPVLPPGLHTLSAEGAGEVQTPLVLPQDCPPVRLGDPVFFQHAKAGELCERFNELLLISKGEIVGRAGTYRGQGMAFL